MFLFCSAASCIVSISCISFRRDPFGFSDGYAYSSLKSQFFYEYHVNGDRRGSLLRRQPGVWWATGKKLIQGKISKVGFHTGPMGCLLRNTIKMMIAAQMEAGRNKYTSNREASRAAVAAREPELIAIGRGLVLAEENQAPSRVRSGIVRHSLGFWGFVFRGSRQIARRLGRMVRLGNLPCIDQYREEEEEEDNEAGGPPAPRHGACQGQGAAGEAVDVARLRGV